MIDKKRIEEEAHNFFEWPDPKRKDHVTLTSCVIFASTIAEMVRAEERERWRDVVAHAADELEALDDETAEGQAAALRQLIGGPNVGNEPTHTARDHFPGSRK